MGKIKDYFEILGICIAIGFSVLAYNNSTIALEHTSKSNMIAEIQIQPDFTVEMDFDYDAQNSILKYSKMSVFNRGKTVKNVSVNAYSLLSLESAITNKVYNIKYIPISDFTYGVTQFGTTKNLISEVYYDKVTFNKYTKWHKQIKDSNKKIYKDNLTTYIYPKLEILIEIEYTNLLNEVKKEYFIASPFGLNNRITLEKGNSLKNLSLRQSNLRFSQLTFEKLQKIVF